MTAAFAWNGQCAEPEPVVGSAGSQVTFISGDLVFPARGGVNNWGTLTQQTVPGVTYMESYLMWSNLEPRKDDWDFKDLDQYLDLCEQRHMKLLVLPWIMTAPDWFKSTPGYAPMTDMQTGAQADFLSPWAPATLVVYDHFYKALAEHCKDRLGIIKLGCAGSTFGEVGLSIADHPYPCGDPYARADFHKRMLDKYGTLASLNSAWGTHFVRASDITFPDPADHASQPVRWVDFIRWIEQSQVRNMTSYLTIIRRYFPDTWLDIPLGFGSDQPRDGCDRTAICRAAAAFKPVTIRSTHGSFNRNPPPAAYWFYKRIAPICHDLQIGFGTEPPGGDLTYHELQRQFFEDASAGVSYVFHYYQNYHQSPDVIGEYKRILRPKELPQVDIGVLYPSTQMIVDMTDFPKGQRQFCDLGRKYFDYDLVDENMIDWGLLTHYKVLIHTGGHLFRPETLDAMTKWLREGGTLITFGMPDWGALTGDRKVAGTWLSDNEPPVNSPGLHACTVGRGRIVSIDAGNIPDYVVKANGALATVASHSELHGYHGIDDGTDVTEFPDGRLVFNTKTLATSFAPKAGSGH
jgi:hypothetical protein